MFLDDHELLFNIFSMKDNLYVHFFIIAVIFDILTGNLRGILSNNYQKLDSSIGLKGLLKHIIVILILLTIYPYLTLLGFKPYANTIMGFYILNYSISVVENLGQLGIKLPHSIIKSLAKLSDQQEENNNDHQQH
ncbi:phage holin protein [Lactobacillus acidipiscis] [Lactiplantibacillus mudanjiangensis]|uniref:phage holin family protein n=1 Tax=Lactiplantibacillus mudanjiangensis TaxID=1296538 RepID=UPI0010157B8F|nr:phage holin family protein [Lactiplantibacillus mudanjiangensis]VDG32261.1 phage holin protein [Lactobacillus acidipiscis] [Lactiplantibacillus mudanjiangensis]